MASSSKRTTLKVALKTDCAIFASMLLMAASMSTVSGHSSHNIEHPVKTHARRMEAEKAWNGMEQAEYQVKPMGEMRRILQEDFYSQKLREDLLQDYDRGAYPWLYVWNQMGWNETTMTGNRSGLPLEVGINFHRVFEVDVKTSVADLVVWFRQRWHDPRLAWDPADYGGLSSVWFWIEKEAGGETSEIWCPDVKLWNMESPISETLSDSYATVNSSGYVYWSRPGHLRAACKFGGLDKFPFDQISCTMEFGSWSYSGRYIRPVKMHGTGFTLGGSETAGQAFTEYGLAWNDAVKCREFVYEGFNVSDDSDWPVLLYDVKFHRSWEPYLRGYVLTQVILNFAGFAAFWIPVTAGERVSLTITAVLAAIASELVVDQHLPNFSEMTWFRQFSLFSLAFAAFSLFQSVAVVYFYYYTGSTLTPRVLRWFFRTPKNWWRRKWERQNTKSTSEKGADSHRKSTRFSLDNKNVAENGSTVVNINTASGQISRPESQDGDDEESIVEPSTNRSQPQDGEEGSIDPATLGDSKVSFAPDVQNGSFESNVDAVDLQDSTASVNVKRRASTWSVVSNRGGFDADDFKDMKALENNRKWQKVAQLLDEACRAFVPVVYLVVLTILLKHVDYR